MGHRFLCRGKRGARISIKAIIESLRGVYRYCETYRCDMVFSVFVYGLTLSLWLAASTGR